MLKDGADRYVGLLLREHDKRRGSALWGKYAAWLEGTEPPTTAVTANTG